ncbi:DUF4411 family protein (plasmid) [Rhizobium leguminosarum bv. trifolii]|uniref:PIN domain-containing protein n=1 Tax=Rhizobium leguminosarum TaxID=384 RepID=UPI00140F98E2|nr:PIN domain-containing protein [Rhizobium leguminosarum]QIO55166.1 DUF4411 family protein [Rhizobium leguminosarum bv. trifolii]
MYVFDTSPVSTLFKNYYRSRFPSLWSLFDEMVADGRIVSTREVGREIADGPVEAARSWATDNQHIFTVPVADEGAFVGKIFSVSHFHQNIEQQKLLKGGKLADPFVIAKAAVMGFTVVTVEAYKENSAKLPNICEHFGVPCLDLERFMEEEGWTF